MMRRTLNTDSEKLTSKEGKMIVKQQLSGKATVSRLFVGSRGRQYLCSFNQIVLKRLQTLSPGRHLGKKSVNIFMVYLLKYSSNSFL